MPAQEQDLTNHVENGDNTFIHYLLIPPKLLNPLSAKVKVTYASARLITFQFYPLVVSLLENVFSCEVYSTSST